MPNTRKLSFEVIVNAPRSRVWDAMISPDTYPQWTAAFCEGSTFKGSWDEGRKIQFVGPDGSGMTAVIAENRRHEFISIQHLGEIDKDGVEDTTSEKVRAWMPAYETYTFSEVTGGTRVVATLDCVPEYEAFMSEAFPKALALLKGLSERHAPSA